VLFWIDGVTCIIAMVILLRALNPKKAVVLDAPDLTAKASPYKDFSFMLFFVAMLFFAVVFLQLFSTMPLYYRDVHFLSEFEIGLLMGLNGMVIFRLRNAFGEVPRRQRGIQCETDDSRDFPGWSKFPCSKFNRLVGCVNHRDAHYNHWRNDHFSLLECLCNEAFQEREARTIYGPLCGFVFSGAHLWAQCQFAVDQCKRI